VAEEVIEMFVALAFALLLIPLALLYVFERMARAGKGPLADLDSSVVFGGTIVPVGGHMVALVDPGPADPVRAADAEQGSAESRLVAALIAGELDRSQYRERMAELAATDAVTRPVRLPPEPA
jgi:hypothetical protein